MRECICSLQKSMLCRCCALQGMRFIQLRGDTPEQVRAWVAGVQWYNSCCCCTASSSAWAQCTLRWELLPPGPQRSQPSSASPLVQCRAVNAAPAPPPLPSAPVAQLRASANFLDRCHPLKHVASEHKSRLQQAIAEMLTAVLTPLMEEGDPR